MSTLLRHLALLTFGAACSLAYDAPPEPERLLSRIAFGSCNSPLELTPVWESIGHRRPDAWIWLGDTVYADSPTPEGPTPAARARVALDRLPQLYARQLALPAYATLRQRARILGTWDDHDYGMNDLGADWIGREEAQRHFLDFYGEPAGSPRRQRPGIYSSYRFGPPGRVVQVILLDTRYFRSPLRRGEFREADWVDGRRGPYVPSEDPNATVLGAAQWAWLEEVLRQPAELRLLVSSIQVIPMTIASRSGATSRTNVAACFACWPMRATAARLSSPGTGTLASSANLIPRENPRGANWTPVFLC